ncbi:MAG: MotA/TolQ/ExbB proton channel family protein [Candidatus Accumulibacter sp.]|nr:MotA/TolQ/ExbB proton channel family protein [Candidatus Accumulibacter conexus]
MSQFVEYTMYQIAQPFLLLVLALVVCLFRYAFWILGEFAMLTLSHHGGGRPLVSSTQLSADQLEVLAHEALELPRIASRVTPMLGLVATMIPVRPALRPLSDGRLDEVSSNLTVAFSAVILALNAASITYWVTNVRRRWLAEELLEIDAMRRLEART